MLSKRTALCGSVIAALAGTTLGLLPSSGAAQSSSTFNCDATAISGALLTAPPFSAGNANVGASQCQNASGTQLQLPANTGLPLSASALSASTVVGPGDNQATASSGVANLGVALNSTALAPLGAAITQALNSMPPIPTAPPSAAISAALQNAAVAIANGNLAAIQVANAKATATCVNGSPQLAGSSTLVGATVLGTTLPADGVINSAITLGTTGQLDNTIPGVLTSLGAGALSSVLTPQIQAALASSGVGAALQGTITGQANRQVTGNGQLTQQALFLNVSLGGQPIITNLVLGQARVSNASVVCGSTLASQTARACTHRKLTLIDVLRHGNRVQLLGAADSSLIGQRVGIYYLVGNRRVATAVVKPSGLFQTTAPLPPPSQRATNLARYQARDSKGERSLDLKLFRRMVVDQITFSGGQVHIKGHIIPPLDEPIAPIYVQRQVSCTKTVNVKRIFPDRSGHFTAVVAPPPHAQVATYRAATLVFHLPHDPRFIDHTYTLPRQVTLR